MLYLLHKIWYSKIYLNLKLPIPSKHDGKLKLGDVNHLLDVTLVKNLNYYLNKQVTKHRKLKIDLFL